MNLLISLDSNKDTAEVIGCVADEDETMACEGCGELVKRLYEDDGMNMLCSACIALMV